MSCAMSGWGVVGEGEGCRDVDCVGVSEGWGKCTKQEKAKQ